MVFVAYLADIKVLVVRMSFEGETLPDICNKLGYSVSPQSLDRWRHLFEETRAVIRYPTTYGQLGRLKKLSSEDSNFMIELLKDEPGLFLDEIRKKLYDATGVLLSIAAVHDNLVNQLCITLKKAETLNIKKCLLKKFQFIDQMRYYPAEFLIGSPFARYIINQNAARLSILPAIGMSGILAMTVRDDMFNAKKFEHFLKWDLVRRLRPGPSLLCLLTGLTGAVGDEDTPAKNTGA
ncbi:hypothetical protein PSTG_09789 [Puccinia striiformis f. sp. tritici PST-78]|uniref:Uncharacterized protein n=1 Tax=Puccinia striiformis f. sp. tritici PST-78 TaxID=1165861 RepID=A0A0L0VC92_9BASI|nr:hypothetical protein PSTG_09789 [Puccinia striiformis f. sp. tritici PST-78]